jgi:eukaryotic-like serine/threonine-protein kinase
MLGSYLLLRRLGTGGMAEVWAARSVGIDGLQQTAVVKTILPHLADNADFLELFEAEAELVAALNHPNIAHYHGKGFDEGVHYIAMELVLGRTLREAQLRRRKQSKALPPWFVLKVAIDVCHALDHAHNHRSDEGEQLEIVHRDITPENVMVSFSGVTKVVDFGIAAAARASNASGGGLTGKIAYLSPEQVLCSKGATVDRRSDIYSVGVLLYEMLTGVQPFRASNDMALVLKIPREIPRPPNEIARWIPTSLSSIIMRALSKKPDRRQQSATQLAEELEACFDFFEVDPTERSLSKVMCELFAPDERRLELAITGATSTAPPPRRSSAPPPFAPRPGSPALSTTAQRDRRSNPERPSSTPPPSDTQPRLATHPALVDQLTALPRDDQDDT